MTHFRTGVIILLFIQLGALIVLSLVLSENEKISRKKRYEDIANSISTNIDKYSLTTTSISYILGEVIKDTGPYISEDYFYSYTRHSEEYVHSVRWLQYVTYNNKEEYEEFYRKYHGNDFRISDILFNGTDFIITNVTEREFYYPYTLSYPRFNLTKMGGDFYANALQFRDYIDKNTSDPEYSSRVLLDIENQFTNYGIYYNLKVVRNSTLLGILQFLFIPSDIFTDLSNTYSENIILVVYDSRSKELLYSSDNKLYDYENANPDFTSLPYEIDIILPDFIISNYLLTIILTITFLFIFLNILFYFIYKTYLAWLNRSKQDYYKSILDYVNHEIRNPLNALVGSLTLLDMTLGEETEGKEKVRNSITQCGIVSYILNRIPDMNTDNVSDNTLEYSNALVSDLINISIAIIESKLSEYPNISMEVDYKIPGKETFIECDKNSIIQVIINLLDNSIKYSKNTEESFIKMTVDIEDNFLVCIVEDNGLGITKNEASKLFTQYTRLKKTKNIKGTGLGLFFCKKICEKHGGKIYIDTGKDYTTFVFKIPLKTEGTVEEEGFIIF